jgi:hypothetical protein
MEKFITKIIGSLILTSLFLSLSAQASDKIKKVDLINPSIELQSLGKGMILIKPVIAVNTNSKAYYEIEKSYDNTHFKTAFVLLTNEDANMPLLRIKDKADTNHRIVYYRLKTVSKGDAKYSSVKIISIQQ